MQPTLVSWFTDKRDFAERLGKTYAFLASGGKSGQLISQHLVELILVPSGSFTRKISLFGFNLTNGADEVRKFPVTPESNIA